jgi:pilus assembly protein Flp/PilA
MLTVTRMLVGGFCKREDGPTAVEYAVMLALIVVVCLAAVAVLGVDTSAIFGTASTEAGGP